MPKFLFQVSYTAEGVKGLLKDGGTGRREAAEHLMESLGGTMESLYFAFGGTDAYVIADLPDNAAAAAGAAAVGSTGAVEVSTTVLLTPGEMDEAVGRTLDYRPPGG